MTKLTELARNYIQRNATSNQLEELFSDPDNCNNILNGDVLASLRGQFAEFLRQEYLQLNGYTLYDKHGKKITDDFHYTGADRADIRAVWQDPNDPTNLDIYVESSKLRNKTLGVGSSEIEGVLIQANKLVRQLGTPSARIRLGIIGLEGVSNNVDKWYNSVRVDNPNLYSLDVFQRDDINLWFKNVTVHYRRNGWLYRPIKSETALPTLNLWWHQERLCSRWGLKMLQQAVKLLVVWGCRTGKTYGSLALMRSYIEEYNKLHGTDKKLRVAIVCSIPTLFDDWIKSVKDIFGDTATTHRHRSGQEPNWTTVRHLFVLSSSQMLNEEDKEQGVDKETNKKVMYSQEFDVLIYDEGHQGLLADNTYKQVIKKIKYQHLVGLTATPFRSGLMNDSIFEHRDIFDYWQQMQMKREGHPDYLTAAERFLFTLKMSPIAKKLFKDLDLTEFGANLASIYTDSRQMEAAIYIMNESVFSPTMLMKNKDHQIRDVIIRADSVAGGGVLLDALRNYVDPIGKRPLQNHLFGFVSGSKSDLPGVEAGFDGVGADSFKSSVSGFFKQKTEHTRKVLIVVDQGIVGHTFETVNTTIDLTNGESLISKYQFWDRGGTQYTYSDGYVKNTYYHFDLNPYRLLAMGKAMRDSKRSDKETEYNEEQFFDLLNLFEIEGGVLFKQINQVEFKNKIDEMLARDKLEQILPSAGTLIVNDGIFDQFNITKPKNGFGSVGFDPYESGEDEEDGPDKTATKKKSKIANMKRQAQQNLEPNTRHAIERFVNIIPMMAALKAIDDRLTEE
jgi:hypothetical protein